MNPILRLLGAELLDQPTELALQGAISQSLHALESIASDDKLFAIASTAFDNNFDTDKLTTLSQQWQQGNFPGFPQIEIIPSASINGANGAYAHSLEKIYLSQEFVKENKHNVEAIALVILEELGHFLETQIKETDTLGDEGRHFAALVLGETVTEEQLQQWQREDLAWGQNKLQARFNQGYSPSPLLIISTFSRA